VGNFQQKMFPTARLYGFERLCWSGGKILMVGIKTMEERLEYVHMILNTPNWAKLRSGGILKNEIEVILTRA